MTTTTCIHFILDTYGGVTYPQPRKKEFLSSLKGIDFMGLRAITHKIGFLSLFLIWVICIPFFIVEVVARILYPVYADDESYSDSMFQMVAKAQVIFKPPGNDHYAKKFGYHMTPNMELIVTKAFTPTLKPSHICYGQKRDEYKLGAGWNRPQ